MAGGEYGQSSGHGSRVLRVEQVGQAGQAERFGAFAGTGLAGFLFAAVYGTALLIPGRATRKQQIPFGPFMIAGAFPWPCC